RPKSMPVWSYLTTAKWLVLNYGFLYKLRPPYSDIARQKHKKPIMTKPWLLKKPGFRLVGFPGANVPEREEVQHHHPWRISRIMCSQKLPEPQKKKPRQCPVSSHNPTA